MTQTAQPNMTVNEWHAADEMLRIHPAVIEALRRRGVTNMDNVFLDLWTYGDALVPDKYRGRRLGWADTWFESEGGANPYADCLGGFHCIVDVNSMELLEIEEGEPTPLPPVMAVSTDWSMWFP